MSKGPRRTIKNSLWIIVTMIVPCTCLPIATLTRSYMLLMTFRPFGVYYGKSPMMNLIPCIKMTLTLLTFLARCSMCGRGTIVWLLGGYSTVRWLPRIVDLLLRFGPLWQKPMIVSSKTFNLGNSSSTSRLLTRITAKISHEAPHLSILFKLFAFIFIVI